jgi:hypothetical protein
MQRRHLAAALAAFAALAVLAPGASAAQICAVTLNMPFGSVVASGTVTPVGTRGGIGFRTWTAGRATAKFVVTWPLIGGTVCSTTIDKNDPALRAAWASARVQGLTASFLTQTVDATGAKAYGSASKQYSVALKGAGYYLGSGAVGAYVNAARSIVLNEFARMYTGTLEGTFGGVPETFQLSGIENKVPLYGCSLQLAEKTSNVVIRCGGLTFAQLPRTSVTSVSGNATLSGSVISFSKATTASVPFSSAQIINV